MTEANWADAEAAEYILDAGSDAFLFLPFQKVRSRVERDPNGAGLCHKPTPSAPFVPYHAVSTEAAHFQLWTGRPEAAPPETVCRPHNSSQEITGQYLLPPAFHLKISLQRI